MGENIKKLDLAIADLDKILVDPTVNVPSVIRDLENQYARAAGILEKYKSAEAYKKRLNHYKEEYLRKKEQHEEKLQKMCVNLCNEYQRLDDKYCKKHMTIEESLSFLQLLSVGNLLFSWVCHLA